MPEPYDQEREVIKPDEVLPALIEAPEGAYEYGQLMQQEAYDNSLRILAAIRGDGRSLITSADLDAAMDMILDLRLELEVNDE